MARLTIALLAVATFALALVAVNLQWSTPLEAVGFVTGAAYVWLISRENVWAWPLGLVNAATSGYVYFQYGLTNDAALQVVYFVLCALGWYWWLHGGRERRELQISSTPRAQWVILLGIALLGSIGLTMVNYRIANAAPAFDASLAVVSLIAQYMVTRKYIENWHLWILVDLVYVPLLLWKSLYLFALLYALFTFMAIGGLREWTRMRGESVRPPMWRPVLAATLLGMIAWGWMGWLSYRLERFYGPDMAIVRFPEKGSLQTYRLDQERLRLDRAKELDDRQRSWLAAQLSDPLQISPAASDPDVTVKRALPIAVLTLSASAGKTTIDVYEGSIGRRGGRDAHAPAIARYLRGEGLIP